MGVSLVAGAIDADTARHTRDQIVDEKIVGSVRVAADQVAAGAVEGDEAEIFKKISAGIRHGRRVIVRLHPCP